ncbi:nucleotidyltransferase [soil metagenome]
MLTRTKAIQLLYEQRSYFATEFGVRRIGLFGSYAKGQADDDSDVDIVVEFEHPIGFRFVELVEYLESLLGREVDVLTPAGIHNIRSERVASDIADSIVYV